MIFRSFLVPFLLAIPFCRPALQAQINYWSELDGQVAASQMLSAGRQGEDIVFYVDLEDNPTQAELVKLDANGRLADRRAVSRGDSALNAKLFNHREDLYLIGCWTAQVGMDDPTFFIRINHLFGSKLRNDLSFDASSTLERRLPEPNLWPMVGFSGESDVVDWITGGFNAAGQFRLFGLYASFSREPASQPFILRNYLSELDFANAQLNTVPVVDASTPAKERRLMATSAVTLEDRILVASYSGDPSEDNNLFIFDHS